MGKWQDLLDEIRSLEEILLDPETRGVAESIDVLLDEGFFEIGSSGRVYEREDVIEELVGEEPRAEDDELVASDYELTPISKDAVLLTYQTERQIAGKAVSRVLRSSIWSYDGDSWLMLFHQGTPAPLLQADEAAPGDPS
ncbi:DUF4440 domain-containing protein [Rhizobium halophytocola]|uniref:DUF4440 domain-containing protein n=1 Tax=Rhizobium halophytocola TaxID=735519 RepID=A0ABS4DWV6_9HYPH|nr:DUF4440 domain-containing protein [Rhizobium halophytocola]MBP1850173.1 hypothetical protein [Rhizobium halophytocola]